MGCRHAIERFRGDLAFRANVSLLAGTAVNFANVAFRAITGILYGSAWFVSLAAYYLVLGGLRLYLAVGYRRRGHDAATELRCYRRVGQLLFLLHVPMVGIVILMVWTDSGFAYPGYVIYLSAMYAFYAMGSSIANILRYRKVGSPILSAGKSLALVSAMMSMLALQTAMIAQFSDHDEGYRMLMNTLTGAAVCVISVLLAIAMLVRSRTMRRRIEARGQAEEQVLRDGRAHGRGVSHPA